MKFYLGLKSCIFNCVYSVNDNLSAFHCFVVACVICFLLLMSWVGLQVCECGMSWPYQSIFFINISLMSDLKLHVSCRFDYI